MNSFRLLSGLRVCAVGVALLGAALPCLAQEAWKAKQAPLMTPWAQDVTADKVLPEYPRPQIVREKWANLNGVWEFGVGADKPASFSKSILVPFPVESALSGVMEHHERVWYRRTFEVPAAWQNQRVMLHFGAVDWECEVFLNGQSLGVHRGGYDPFSFDLTEHLKAEGKQELVVRVYDPTENGGQPRGKQATQGIPILYTPCTGIWQTVWLEPTPKVAVEDLEITPDVDKSVVRVTVTANGSNAGVPVTVVVKDGLATVAEVTGKAGEAIEVPIKSAKLWSPDSPFLYDLQVSVKSGETTDTVKSYFGMRKASLAKVGSFNRILLNDAFVFQLGALDQGFWPDGIYTAPTDEALKFDIEQQKKLGFNMIRKHVKVEPARWYYWADKLGMLVWQDMPTAESYGGVPADAKLYPAELKRMVETLYNVPSIVMWVVYNEKCGQDAHIKQGLTTAALVDQVRQLDGTRLVNEASGYDWYGSGDIADSHTYPAPGARAGQPNQAITSGEFGAIKFPIKGHQWAKADEVTVSDEKDYLRLYTAYATGLSQLKGEGGLCGAVYTQFSDVETEQNGIFTYDRKATKTDLTALREANLRAIRQHVEVRTLLPTSRDVPQSWHFTTTKPADDWMKPAFADDAWTAASGPFAEKGSPGIKVGTSWTSDDIWLRKEFTLARVAEADLTSLCLTVYHDDECEVYLNGVKIADLGGTARYAIVPLGKEAAAALKPEGPNRLAVHCHEGGGDQGIDVGLGIMRFVND